MSLKKSIRWGIVVIFIGMVFAAPKSALADCGSGYPYGSNCCANADGTNCIGNQGGSTCYDFAGGTMCYVNQSDGNSYVPPTNNNTYVPPNYGNQQPNYGNPYVPPNYGNYPLYAASPAAGTYVVQWGDTMLIIANRFGVSLNSLITANPQIWNPSQIYAGQVLNLPSYSSQVTYYQQYNQQGQNWGFPSNYNYNDWGSKPGYWHPAQTPSNLYTIQPGDTLSKVARKYHTTVQDLLDLNPNLLGRPSRIHVGLVILLW